MMLQGQKITDQVIVKIKFVSFVQNIRLLKKNSFLHSIFDFELMGCGELGWRFIYIGVDDTFGT